MLKQNRNALTNLTNRYRAVLRRCRLRALALALACALTAPPLPAGADSGGMGNGDTYIGNGDGAGNNGGVFIDTNMWKFVHGGYAPHGGTATKNTVTINAGGSAMYVYGGYAPGGGTATKNTVTINGSAFNVSGGQVSSGSGNATKNTVTINGSAFNVYGGQVLSGSGNATKNTVTINGSAFNVYGGQVLSGSGNATKNTVTINGSAFNVYGGQVLTGSGNATKNTVTINGSAVVGGNVYGGQVAVGSGNATDNTLSISGAPTLSSCSISGGFSHNGDAVTGNLLELRTSNLTVKCIQNFAAYAFVLPATIQSGDVLLTATDAIDLTNSGQISSPDFQRIDVTGDTPLSVGDTVTLLQSDAGLTAGELRESVSGSHGVTLSYTFKLTADGNAVVATVMGDEDLPPMDDDDDTPDTPTGNEGGASVAPRVNPQTKALAEGYLSGVALTLQGADLVAGKGIDAAGRAVRASLAGGGKGLAAFGALSGGWSRYNTGSHIDVSGFSLLTGLAWGADSVPGQFTAGMFFEYGSAATGTYNSFSNAASVSGDGSTWYMGAGLLARMDFNDSGPGHIYAEASARAGALNNKYRNDDLRDASGRRAEFDTSTPYVSLHAGLGYVWDLTDALSLDLSAKYFWTWQDSADSDLSTGEALHFDAVNSHRLRLGGRLTWAVTEHVSPYVGAAWEHEFDGKARATSLGYDLDAPSLTGDTGIGELGLSWTPSATIPLTIDLSLQGYTGVREGYTGSLMAKWEF